MGRRTKSRITTATGSLPVCVISSPPSPPLSSFPSFPFLPFAPDRLSQPKHQHRTFSASSAWTIRVVALTHVRVVDGTGAKPLDDQTVVISGGKIAAIHPAGSGNVPAGAKVMDLKGHTVIPGIVGLHDHTFYTTNLRSVQSNATAPLLYLGSGVTTIRTTGSHSPYAELNLQAPDRCGADRRARGCTSRVPT